MPGAGGARIGYGIIGCGWVATPHALGVKALADEDVELVAVADRDLERAGQLGQRFGVPHVLADYEELLRREDVHVVSICLPDYLHEEVAVAAAAHGKHVLCEKPLALDLAGADAMVAACDRNGVNLGVVFNHRYAPDNIKTRAAIRDGALGRLLLGDVLHSSSLTGDPDNSSPWRGRVGKSAGGVLATQAIHFLDLLLWFAGPVSSVQAHTASLVGQQQDHEDTAAVTLQLQSGALATLVTTNGAPITDDFTGTRVEIQGTEGYIVLEGDEVRTWSSRVGYQAPAVSLPPLPADTDGAVFGDGHIHQVVDFVRALRRGKGAPIPGADGRHLMAVLSAAYRSASDGGPVAVEEDRDAYSRTSEDPGSVLWASGRSA
jgi:predicted dehydrogenase